MKVKRQLQTNEKAVANSVVLDCSPQLYRHTYMTNDDVRTCLHCLQTYVHARMCACMCLCFCMSTCMYACAYGPELHARRAVVHVYAYVSSLGRYERMHDAPPMCVCVFVCVCLCVCVCVRVKTPIFDSPTSRRLTLHCESPKH